MDFIATVSFADEERMVVVLPGAGALAELQTDGILGVQLYFDETSYRAMFEALEDTIRAKDNRLAELRDICWVPKSRDSANYILSASHG